MNEPLPLHARLVEAKLLPGGLLWITARLIAAPASVINTPVHLELYANDVAKLKQALEQPAQPSLSLADALALGLPGSTEEVS